MGKKLRKKKRRESNKIEKIERKRINGKTKKIVTTAKNKNTKR